MRYNYPKFIVLFFFLFGCGVVKEGNEASKENPALKDKVGSVEFVESIGKGDVEQYITRYQDIAKGEMAEFKIPASITMAQAVLESGAGKSTLALESNNHFGIKCHSNWKGKTIKHDDDKKNECFRVYDNVEDSFSDHSQFLQGNRYKFLYNYKITDYKDWAKGLKKAGYATNPKYADILISLIEKYQLYLLDEGKKIAFVGFEGVEPVKSKFYKPSNRLIDTHLIFVKEPSLFTDLYIKWKGYKRKRRREKDERLFVSEGSLTVIKDKKEEDKEETPKKKEVQEKETSPEEKDVPKDKPEEKKPEKKTVVLAEIQTESIPESKAETETTEVLISTYVVKKGDTLYSISKRFEMSVSEIKKLNNLSGTNLRIGQKLKVKK